MRSILVLLLGCTAACTTGRSSSDAAAAASSSATSADTTTTRDAATVVDPFDGEWERRSEPYAGMRIAITVREGTRRAVVTTAPPVTEARLATMARTAGKATAKAQLACQQSVWRSGEEFVSGIRSSRERELTGTILVRDWGFTGTCRHADSHAPARLSINEAGELSIEVTRGKIATQTWARVPRP